MECRHEDIRMNMETGVKYCLLCGKEIFERVPEKQCPICKKEITINEIHSCIETKKTWDSN